MRGSNPPTMAGDKRMLKREEFQKQFAKVITDFQKRMENEHGYKMRLKVDFVLTTGKFSDEPDPIVYEPPSLYT